MSRSRPSNVAILGSCVTRDIFNYAEEGEYRIVDYTARTSLGSAFSGKAMRDRSIRLDSIDSPSQRRQVDRDINKLYPKILAGLNFDILLVDCIDERFKLHQNSEGALCTVSKELMKSGFKPAAGGRYIPPCSDEFFSLWIPGWQRLLTLLAERKCLNRLYVNMVFWSDRVESGAGHEKFAPRLISDNNAFLERLYRHMRKSLPAENFLTFPPEILLGAADHVWGQSPFHYIDDYYLAALKQVANLVR